MTDREKLKKLFAKLDEIDAYGRCIGKVNFDQCCSAPEEGMEQAGEDMALLGKQVHRLTHAKSYTDLICQLHESGEGLTPVEKRTVECLYEDWEKSKNCGARFSYEMDRAFSTAYAHWLKAKQTNDFALFRPALEKVGEFTRRSVELRDQKPLSPYDACLDDFEKGGSIAQLDGFFAALKGRIVPLVKKIQAEGKPIRRDFLHRPVPAAVQEAFSRTLLEIEGLRKTALVLTTTEHPFTTHFGSHDVRVATHYYEENFFSGVFSTLHEGGHALFMQNEPEELYQNHCAGRMSNAMHECISRFYENIIGRSEAMTGYLYPRLREITGETFADVTPRELYEAVNAAKPGLIRTEADELTYCLHILVRYEIEKLFINGEIKAEEIPALWNAKYKEYLGVEVPSDTEGCLQDVHWTMSFGYFPSYALGSAYGAQILRTMEKDF